MMMRWRMPHLLAPPDGAQAQEQPETAHDPEYIGHDQTGEARAVLRSVEAAGRGRWGPGQGQGVEHEVGVVVAAHGSLLSWGSVVRVPPWCGTARVGPNTARPARAR